MRKQLIRLMTDSVSDITKEQAESLGISLLCMPITVDGKALREIEDFTKEEFYPMIENSREFPSTAQLNPFEITEAYEKHAAEGCTDLIFVTIGAGGSGTYANAEAARQAYYDGHPVMYLNTPEGNYRLDIFAGFVTWYDSRVYSFDFESRTEFEEWLNLMRGYSDFSSDVKVGQDDRVVTLSTCTYDYDNARYVLMAKLVPLDSN